MYYSTNEVVIFDEGDKIAKLVLSEIHQAHSLKESEGEPPHKKKRCAQIRQKGK